MGSEPATAYETVNVERRGAAVTIELNRPRVLNAWNGQLGVDLREALAAAAADGDVRAVVVTGAGRAFSSGADLRDPTRTLTAEGRPDVRATLVEDYHPIITSIREMGKPVVAAVNGPCVGIGLSLALACDLVLARESATFMLAFVGIGFVPDGGSSLFIPARVGFARAAELALLGEPIDARQALDWGLINRVCADEGFDQEVEALADRLAAGPTLAYAGIKRELNRAMYGDLADQLELEASLQEQMSRSDDFVEGATAFIAKRAPTFRGR